MWLHTPQLTWRVAWLQRPVLQRSLFCKCWQEHVWGGPRVSKQCSNAHARAPPLLCCCSSLRGSEDPFICENRHDPREQRISDQKNCLGWCPLHAALHCCHFRVQLSCMEGAAASRQLKKGPPPPNNYRQRLMLSRSLVQERRHRPHFPACSLPL
jgi:hypothetical protein